MNRNDWGVFAQRLRGAGWILLLGLALGAAASSRPSATIAVVDSKRIAAESKTIRALIADAAAKADKMRGELEKNRAELASRLDAYSLQKSVIADDEKLRREEAIQSLKDEIEVLEIRLNRELKRSQEGMVGPMGLKILSAIREEARQGGWTVVFTTEDLVHYDAACDITPQVIKRLDK